MPEDENVVEETTDTEETNDNEDEEETAAMGKLKRSALAHYLDEKFGGTNSPVWFLIGKHVQDMSVEMNADMETFRNILDEPNATDNGYAPTIDVDTYYADPSDGDFYDMIKDITMNRKTDDDCRTTLLEVLIDKTTGPYDAWSEDVIIKPQSYGGAPGGVRIPYQIIFVGNRTQGTVTITNKVPTFTAAT